MLDSKKEEISNQYIHQLKRFTKMKNYHKENKCRICSNTNLKLILDLENQPPANSFIKKEKLLKPEKKFPLRLFLCDKCFLVQLLDIVSKEYLFSHYLYMTSASKPIVNHFKIYANEICKKFFKQKKDAFIVEIGSNDGSLLKEFKMNGIDVLGIEPASNIAKIANDSGITTINQFFTFALAKKLSSKKASMIVANNVLAHVENLQDLIKGVKTLLKNDGIFVFEVPYLLNLIEKMEFDTIYHEHLSYFSIKSLKKLMDQNQLEIIDVKKQKVHGGTIRVFVSKKGVHTKKANVLKILNLEKEFGISKIKTYKDFAKRVLLFRTKLLNQLNKLKQDGKNIFGYGAPAKGNVLLNFCNIDTNYIEFLLDTTPIKQKMYSPGMHIPIKSADIINSKGDRDIALLLAWNYKKEILEKENNFRKRGGKFLVPIPNPKLI